MINVRFSGTVYLAVTTYRWHEGTLSTLSTRRWMEVYGRARNTSHDLCGGNSAGLAGPQSVYSHGKLHTVLPKKVDRSLGLTNSMKQSPS